ncbi:MAG: hypothetical protein AMXMBFR58_28950 [Phycisphaerae bacterium]
MPRTGWSFGMSRDEHTADTPSTAAGARSIIASTLTIGLVAALVFGLYKGITPLEDRTVSIIGARSPTVDVQWPVLGATTGGQKSRSDSPLNVSLLSVTSTSLDNAPSWLPKQMQEDIRSFAQRNLDPVGSPLSVDPLRKLGSAMERSGWFDGRPTVRREAGGRVVITGEWRIPGAVIREGGKDYMVSWDGKPMPVIYEARESKLPAIIGVAIKPPAAGANIDYTKAWPGEDVQAGLELLRVVQGKKWSSQVEAIDVSNYEKTHTLSIVTTGNGRLNWGGRPNKPRLGEAGTSAKLATIDWLQKRFGSIDAGGRTFDIYWLGRPLEIDVSASAQQGRVPSEPDLRTSPLPRD